MRLRSRFVGPALLVVVLADTMPASAADPALEQAKTLYASASFEDALAAIGRVDNSSSAEPEVLLYKALCLLALGRPQEAAIATKTIVSAAPTFAPDTGDLPPRFQTLWTETRKAALPAVTRALFASARGRFQSKEFVPALAQFQQVVQLTDDPSWKDSAEATDLRTLASGFTDLAQASIPKPDPGPPASAVIAAPAPTLTPVVVELAVPIRQEMPRWSPPDRAIGRLKFDGAVRVLIDAAGKVTEATMVRPTHASYDVALLRAARDWSYKPALRNGTPIASERLVEVHLTAANEE